ncbi:MAG: 3-methyl-2-oxobutanoate hydroxymethyltransferase, partial [Actinomycetaceae bacterium]|nr:3-methyl-2-oxobutanoate hydroxymethyltransferase [Actinomycetaceae bacterium]
MAKKVRVHHFAEKKQEGEKIVMLTAYDAMTAKIFDDAGVDSILVGDSYGTTMLGYPSTIPVDMSDMVRATAAVARGAQRPFIIADMPLGAAEPSNERAIDNAIFLLKAGAEAVKVEGGVARAHTIRAIVDAGINVCGHIGYTPQSINALGGPRVQGRGESGYERLRADALAVQEAGAFAVVLEMVPAPLAEKITED